MRTLNVRTICSAISLGSMCLSLPTAVYAQSGMLEEVVVTARKKQESQQDLPITLTAFSGNAIKSAVIENVTDLGRAVPGLHAQRNSQGGAPVYALRGTKTDNRIDGGVTVYIDDMPLIQNFAASRAFYDISSVEVLKGPQGTQFGANTTGGTISIRSNKPTDEFEGYIEAGVSNYSGRHVEAMVNLPVTDWMQVRLAGQTLERDGFVDNLMAGGPDDFNNEDFTVFRATLRVTNNEGFTNDLIYDYHKSDTSPRVANLVEAANTGPATITNLGAVISNDPYKVYQGTDPNSGVTALMWLKNENWGIQNVTNWEINDNWSLRNVIGYREDDDDSADNNDGSPLFLVSVRTRAAAENFVDDFTLTYKSDDDGFTFSTGLYYQDYDKELPVFAQFAENFALVGFLQPFPPGPFVGSQVSTPAFENTYKAVYANTDIKLSDNLTLTAGIRHNWDTVKVNFITSQGAGLPYAGAFQSGPFTSPTMTTVCNVDAISVYPEFDVDQCYGADEEDFNAYSYNIGLTGTFSDNSMAYFKASGGYLVGGFNTGIPEPARTFKPEKTNTFEAGIKSDWELGGRPIRTNIAGYWGESKNKQQSQNIAIRNSNGTVRQQIGAFNAGLLNFYGVELELIYNLFDGFDFSLGYNKLYAEYDSFVFPAVGLTPEQDFSGSTPAQMPEDTLTLSMTYRWPFSSDIGTVTSTLSGYYTSDFTISDVANVAPFFDESANEVGSYDVWQFYTAWDGVFGSGFDVSLWVDNLFDDEIVLRKNVQAGFGYRTIIYGDPRSYGLNLKYNF